MASNTLGSKKLYYLIETTETKSVLDYTYWETKILNQIINQNNSKNFERNFINLAILTKNNEKKKK